MNFLLKRNASLIVHIIMSSSMSVGFHFLFNDKRFGEKHPRGTNQSDHKEYDA